MFGLWLALQVLALALAAGRVSLSARFPQPIERQATAEMLAVQALAASLLFPLLLNGWMKWSLVAASIWPMLVLANLLGGDPPGRLVAAGVYMTLWLTALAAWRSALREEWSQRLAVAAAALWTIGGPVLLYLRAEFRAGQPISPAWFIAAGPVWTAISRLRGSEIALMPDILQAALALAGMLIAGLRVFYNFKSSAKLSTKL